MPIKAVQAERRAASAAALATAHEEVASTQADAAAMVRPCCASAIAYRDMACRLLAIAGKPPMLHKVVLRSCG